MYLVGLYKGSLYEKIKLEKLEFVSTNSISQGNKLCLWSHRKY